MMGAHLASTMALLKRCRQIATAAKPWGLLAAASTSLNAAAAPFVPMPSSDSLRQVQLAALACARENTAASCERARQLAEPLLDHPRLAAACKDQAWSIRQKAQPAPDNSFARREAISQPAGLLLTACRSNDKPAPAAAPPAAAPASGGGGFGFGGGR
jgi:hypothetical protein